MPKKIQLSEEQENLMRRLFAPVDYSIGKQRRRRKGTMKQVMEALRESGVDMCEDTTRRYAVRLGLIEPVGAKYHPKRKHDNPTWQRPCMICKSTVPRPKYQYICDKCKRDDCSLDVFDIGSPQMIGK